MAGLPFCRRTPTASAALNHRLLSCDQIERVRELLLKRSQIFIAEMAAYSASDSRSGSSPSFWRVVECDAKTDYGMVTGSELGVWIVTADAISPAPKGTTRQPGARNGMYHSQGHAAFFLHPTELLCWFDYQVGPRYGCGSRIQLAVSSDGMVSIAGHIETWRS